MKRKLVFGICALPLILIAGSIMLAAYSGRPYESARKAGTQYFPDSSRLTFVESAITHPTHTSGFVEFGDPVLVGDEGIVGVAMDTATAATDYVTLDTKGIWNLVLTNSVAMSRGDAVYINKTTAALTDSPTGSVMFGYVLVAVTTTAEATTVPIALSGTTYELATIGAVTITGAAVAQSTLEVEGATSAARIAASQVKASAGLIATAGGLQVDTTSTLTGNATTARIAGTQLKASAGVIATAGGVQDDTTATITGKATLAGGMRVGGATLPAIRSIEVTSTTLTGADNTTFTLTTHGYVAGKTIFSLSLETQDTSDYNPMGIGTIDNWKIESTGQVDGQVAMTSATAGTIRVHCIAVTIE